jgi:hypothetical protein
MDVVRSRPNKTRTPGQNILLLFPQILSKGNHMIFIGFQTFPITPTPQTV